MNFIPLGENRSKIPDPGSFESLGSWFEYVRAEGFNVPVQVPWAIQRAEQAWSLDSQQAFERLVASKLMFVYPGGVTVDLRATTQDLNTHVSDDDVSNMDG